MCSKFHVYSCSRSWDIHLLPHLLLSLFSFFNDSWSIRIQMLKKAAHVKHFFILFTFINTKRKQWKKKEKPFIKNVHTMEAVHWIFIVYLILFTEFFRLFNLVYSLFSRTFLIVSTIFFWPEVAKISFSAIARYSSKEQ